MLRPTVLPKHLESHKRLLLVLSPSTNESSEFAYKVLSFRGFHRRGFAQISAIQGQSKKTWSIISDSDLQKGAHSFRRRTMEHMSWSKVGGLIGYDNTLWNGSVVMLPDAPLCRYRGTTGTAGIEICMLSIGDGITLCRRIS